MDMTIQKHGESYFRQKFLGIVSEYVGGYDTAVLITVNSGKHFTYVQWRTGHVVLQACLGIRWKISYYNSCHPCSVSKGYTRVSVN